MDNLTTSPTALRALSFVGALLIGLFAWVFTQDLILMIAAAAIAFVLMSRTLIVMSSRLGTLYDAHEEPATELIPPPNQRRFERHQRPRARSRTGGRAQRPNVVIANEEQQEANYAVEVDETIDVTEQTREEQDRLAAIRERLESLRRKHNVPGVDSPSVDTTREIQRITAEEVEVVAPEPRPSNKQANKQPLQKRRRSNQAETWLDELNVLDRMIAYNKIDDLEYERQYNRIVRKRDRYLDQLGMATTNRTEVQHDD